MRKLLKLLILIKLLTFTTVYVSFAKNDRGQITNLPIPRFVSLKASEGNIRRGPSLSQKIDWVLLARGIPLKIVDEHEHWRRVIDHEGASGWIHYSLISGARTVLVLKDMSLLYKKPQHGSNVKAKIEVNAIGSLGQCDKQWCFIKFSTRKGWVKRSNLWGLLENEIR